MSALLEVTSGWMFQARRTRIGLFVPVVAMLIAVVLIMQAKPEDFVDTAIYPYTAASSPIPLLQKYVRVRGSLVPAKAAEGVASIGKTEVNSGSYVPIFIDGAIDPLFVANENLPAVPDQGGTVEIVGLLQSKASFPTLYLTIEAPPNIPLLNNLARIGIVLGTLVLLWWLLSWLVSRSDFALRSPGAAERPGLGLIWFGSLGSAEGNALVRQAPVQLVITQHEVKLQAADSREGWSVHVRDLKSAQPVRVATPYGALPALRLRFVDERGQSRSGTVVAGDSRECDALRSTLETRASSRQQSTQQRGAAMR